MKSFIIIFLLFSFSIAQAEPIFSLRDWSAEKNIDTILGKKGCVAETVFTDEVSNEWKLQVIKLLSNNGEYSAPVIMAFPTVALSEEYYEGVGQSDRAGTKAFSMTLLQPENQNINPLGSRMTDKTEMLRRLRADNTFTVQFMNKEVALKEVGYSLSGSSKTINAMDSSCQ